MSLKSIVMRPVTALAVAAILTACGGGSNVTPVPLPTGAPAAAPVAAAPASAQSSQTLESVVAQCGTSPKNEVLISVAGKEPLSVPVGNWINDYSQRVAGIGLPRFGFECVSAVYDHRSQLVFAYGQDKSAHFPAELTVIDPKTGKEVGHVMHPGHIKGVVPFYGVNTPKGAKDVLVVAALSNIGELVGNEPYVPVVFVVDRGNMQVMAYEVVSPSGQALDLKAGVTNGAVDVSFRIDRDSPGVRRVVPLANLFNQAAQNRAQKYQSLFR